jgi:hypothetical protein
VNPEFISILKIELQRSAGDPKVNVDTNPVFQIAIYGSETYSNNTDVDGDCKGTGIDVSRELFVSLT